MKAGSIKVSVNIPAPTNWMGTYTSNNGSHDDSWSWYKDGDSNKINFPHITVAFKLSHEVAKNGDLVGFHVSFPMKDGAKNARFNYSVAGGVAKYSNTTKTGFTESDAAQVQEIGDEYAGRLDEFANSFYQAVASGKT